ncbi:TdcF translation initiation inhibitor yjgF family, partial [Pyrenophora tritici-repentis]
MAHLPYCSYPGFGETKREEQWYNQAVHVGDYIEIASQGGWDPETSKIPIDLNEEIDQAFAKVDYTLKHAGGNGWSPVYKIILYLTAVGEL